MFTQLKLALRILRRRKFFTFISLFGISFTIMALVVIAAMGDAALGDNPPLSKRDRLVFATHFRAERVVPDTSYIVDSTELADGTMEYDSTAQIGENVQSDNNSGVAFYLYERHLLDLDGVEHRCYMAPSGSFDTYLDGRKVTLDVNYTDAGFWDIFDYEFVHGQAYSAQEVGEGARQAVLTDKAAENYFGEVTASLLGRELVLGDQMYTVAGIVARPRSGIAGLNSSVFIPITTAPQQVFNPRYLGGGTAVFEADSGGSRDIIVDQLAELARALPTLPDDDANRFYIEGLTFGEEFADGFMNEGKNRSNAFAYFFVPLLVLLALFVLLPILNLTNINVSRVYERASEIAVRKSFGASETNILGQFLTETLFITMIGGVIGVLLALGLIALINGNNWLADYVLRFTPSVALYALLIILLFALFTGLLPAWRMSRTQIATSLR